MLFASSSGVTLGGDWGILATILQDGVVGLVLICLITGKFLVTRRELDRADREHAKEIASLQVQLKESQESNVALRVLTEQQIIPALVRANQLASDYNQDLAAERRRDNGGSSAG